MATYRFHIPSLIAMEFNFGVTFSLFILPNQLFDCKDYDEVLLYFLGDSHNVGKEDFS